MIADFSPDVKTSAQDKATSDIAATWDLIAAPDSVAEVRAILANDERGTSPAWDGFGNIITGYFDNKADFVNCVTKLDKSKHSMVIYATLNPINKALRARANNRMQAAGKKTSTTADENIIRRHLLLIDADPFRPAGISSTQEELDAAIALRDKMSDWLRSKGFPQMVHSMSGNGGHLLGRIDMPNDDESKQLLSDFLQALDAKFGTTPSDSKIALQQFNAGKITVGVDKTVFNASRINKIYGTQAGKGDAVDDRPHRRAEITFMPEQLDVIPTELIKRIVQEHQQAKQTAPAKTVAQASAQRRQTTDRTVRGGEWAKSAEGVEQWFSDKGITLGKRETYTSNGFDHKWDVDCLTCGGVHKDGAIIMWGANKGLAYKCHHNSCAGKGWADVRATVAPKQPVQATDNGNPEALAEQPSTVASTPVTIVNKYRSMLRGYGYTDEQINAMTPVDALAILNQKKAEDEAEQVIDAETGEIADVELTDEIQAFLDEEIATPMTPAEIKAAVDTKAKSIDGAVNDEQREAIQREVIALVAQVDDAFLLDQWAATLPKKLGMSKSGYKSAIRNERAAADEKLAEAHAKMADAKARMVAAKVAQLQQNAAPHPYVFQDGMMQIYQVAVNEETGTEEETYTPICTFTAQITGEIRDEFDNITYIITGQAIRGGAFTAQIDTETFGSPSKLKVAIEACAGALDTVFAKMETHLGPAIKLLSEGVDVQRMKRYDRTGWIGGKFHIPGRVPDGVTIELPKVLPYRLEGVTDDAGALEALTLLMQSMPKAHAPVMLSSVMGPPAATLAGLSNHRYATMNMGQTGAYKTGVGMAFMSIWGAGFLDKDNLIKWGTGTTGNALMHVSTSVHALPELIDNYKSNTDRDNEFVKFIHAALEGGEKLRMKGGKINQLRDVRDIQAWPVCTGEDMPSGDPATMARFIVIKSRKNPNGVPDGIKTKSASRLHQIGAMWLDSLEGADRERLVNAVADRFDKAQSMWREYLLKCNQGMPNVDRVASTLALNEACFYALTLHPIFGHVLKPYLVSHKEGLQEIGQQMSGATTDGLEAYRFMVAIREMLSTGRAILVKSQTHLDGLPKGDNEKVIGWDDSNGGAYLYPTTARMMVEKVMGVKLSDMSNAAIGNQLMELGWIASHDKGRSEKTRKNQGKTLHVNAKALSGDDDATSQAPCDDDDDDTPMVV